MTDKPLWLTEPSHELLKQELTNLLRQRAMQYSTVLTTAEASGDRRDSSTEHIVPADDRQRNQRIRRIQEILLNSVVGREAADDGIAEPGMVLTVRYESDSEDETFLLAHREGVAHSDVEVCSPDSPLGRALCGAQEGERRQYRLPDGQTRSVQLIRASPYRCPSVPS